MLVFKSILEIYANQHVLEHIIWFHAYSIQ